MPGPVIRFYFAFFVYLWIETIDFMIYCYRTAPKGHFSEVLKREMQNSYWLNGRAPERFSLAILLTQFVLFCSTIIFVGIWIMEG